MTTQKTEDRIKEIFEQEITPALAMDGGSADFIGFQDGIVSVKLQGACHGCPGAAMTLKYGIENRLKQELSDVREVVAV